MTIRFALISAALLSACGSSPTPSASSSSELVESGYTAEIICDGVPKNCPPMPQEALTLCLDEMSKRESSACFDKLGALKTCFVKTSECDESGELIENDSADNPCAFENIELEVCCEANPGDASCQF